MGGRTYIIVFMKTERATETALSGGSISKESFAISIAIFAAPYAAFQADSLDDPGSPDVVSVGLQDGEATDRAMALDKAASALRSFARGWNVASSCLMYSMIGGGLSVASAGDEDLCRKRGMVGVRKTTCRSLLLDLC